MRVATNNKSAHAELEIEEQNNAIRRGENENVVIGREYANMRCSPKQTKRATAYMWWDTGGRGGCPPHGMPAQTRAAGEGGLGDCRTGTDRSSVGYEGDCQRRKTALYE